MSICDALRGSHTTHVFYAEFTGDCVSRYLFTKDNNIKVTTRTDVDCSQLSESVSEELNTKCDQEYFINNATCLKTRRQTFFVLLNINGLSLNRTNFNSRGIDDFPLDYSLRHEVSSEIQGTFCKSNNRKLRDSSIALLTLLTNGGRYLYNRYKKPSIF
jgi:hypothetical protein